jgi:hypothetical protein
MRSLAIPDTPTSDHRVTSPVVDVGELLHRQACDGIVRVDNRSDAVIGHDVLNRLNVVGIGEIDLVALDRTRRLPYVGGIVDNGLDAVARTAAGYVQLDFAVGRMVRLGPYRRYRQHCRGTDDLDRPGAAVGRHRLINFEDKIVRGLLFLRGTACKRHRCEHTGHSEQTDCQSVLLHLVQLLSEPVLAKSLLSSQARRSTGLRAFQYVTCH